MNAHNADSARLRIVVVVAVLATVVVMATGALLTVARPNATSADPPTTTGGIATDA